MRGYIETPDCHHVMPRATLEKIEPVNQEIAEMFDYDRRAGAAPWVKVADYDGEFEIYRADRISIVRKG